MVEFAKIVKDGKNMNAADDLLHRVGGRRYHTVVADPPWQFRNRTGKCAPEHGRLFRYATITFPENMALPVPDILVDPTHLYLWSPAAMLPEALDVMVTWGFEFKTVLAWHKMRKDGASDGRGCGFYFRNVLEYLLFGIRGKSARTLQPARSQVNLIAAPKREHSRKPDEFYPIIEACSPEPCIELFARSGRPGWAAWGNEVGGPQEQIDLMTHRLPTLGIAVE